MSRHYVDTFTCPECMQEGDIQIWSSINTMLDPEMKEKVRTGEAFMWECPHCGYKVPVVYATLYHQMEDKIMIYFVEDKVEAVEIIKRLSGEGEDDFDILGAFYEADYTIRVVDSIGKFREKLKIFDEKLDDRVMELTKAFLRYKLLLSDPGVKIKEFLFDTTADGTKLFSLLLDDGNRASIDYEEDLYDSVKNNFKEIIDTDENFIIDSEWADNILLKKD